MILEGKPIAKKIYQDLAIRVKNLKKSGKNPFLAVILIGEDPASISYIDAKEKSSQDLGVGFKLFHFPAIIPEKEVKTLICDLNQNKFIDGIVVQLPLPKDFNVPKILKNIDLQKDIDGFSNEYHAPTAQAIFEIFKYYKIPYQRKKIVIVGQGILVGKPLLKMFQKKGIKPIICDSKTSNLKKETLSAEILITATGVPGLIKPDMVSKKVVLIDAGAAKNKGKIVGDVSFETYKKVKSYTPVPGGIGPVTVACLLKNLISASKISR